MTDYDDLCKELRDPQSHSEPRLWRVRDAAADAIATLREQVAWEKTINEGLRSIQPAWAEEKWITAAALTQIWNKLGAKNQTEAILALEKAEADNAALRQLLTDMKPHWDGFTRKVNWTAAMAGVMADIRTRLDAALLAGKG